MMAKVTQAHIDQRRDDIVLAARELFARKGVHETSIQEVAAEAGISTGAVYRYFSGKDELLRAVFERASAVTHATMLEAPPQETVLATLKSIGMEVMTDPSCPDPRLQLELSLQSARDPEVWGPQQREFALGVLRDLEGLVETAKAAGEISTELDTAALAKLLYAMVPGLSALQVQLGDEADIESVLDVVIGLLARSKERAQPQT